MTSSSKKTGYTAGIVIKLGKLLLLGVFLGLTVFVTKLYFHSGFPYTHDGESHLARFAAYKIAVREVQIPPRYAGNLLNHYGYPVFNFNYPLANILSLPLSLTKISYELSYKIIVFLSLFLGVVGAFSWCRTLSLRTVPSVVAAAVYASQPYMINLIYFRGGVGEIMAYCLFPWMMMIVAKIRNESRLRTWEIAAFILLAAAFQLSHNGSAVFGLIILSTYAAISFRTVWSEWLDYVRIMLTATLLTLWFWLPAIWEKSWTILDSSGINQLALDHFATLKQLLFSPLEFGFSYVGSIDSLGYPLGLVGVISLMLSILALSLTRSTSREKNYRPLWYLVVACGVLIFLQLPASTIIWQAGFGLFKFIQFPWRLSFFWSILIIPLIAWVFDRARSWLKVVLLTILGAYLVSLVALRPADYFHRTNVDYEAFSQTTSTQNENLARDFTYENIADWQPTPTLLKGQAQIEVLSWRGSHHVYKISAETQVEVVEPAMWFPGWKTSTNPVPQTHGSEWSEVEYQPAATAQGRISYILNPGSYVVDTQFTQETWPRLIGNGVSLITAMGLGLWFVTAHRSGNKK